VAPSFRSRSKRDRSTSPETVEGAVEGHGAEEVEVEEEEAGGGDWIAYELHEWAAEPRRMLAQLLTADAVPHSWQGTTLLVHEAQEEVVDELVEEVEEATEQRIESGEPVVGFEMGEWSGDLQAELLERLGGAGVPHEIDDEGDLVVREADEEQVELVIEDLIARAGDEGLEELDGLEVNSLLTDLFVACDRLRRDVRDADGVLAAVEHGRRLTEIRTPYGFAAVTWRGLRDRSAELVDMLEGGDVDDEELRSHAHELRDVLQRLV
jgi:hypothetical protein